MKPTLRPALVPCLVTALSLTVSCGGGGDPAGGEVAGGPDGPRDTLVIAEGSDFNSMISIVSQSASDSNIAGNIFFDVLDSDFDCELTYKPRLVKSYDWNEDGTVLSMELRTSMHSMCAHLKPF